MLHLLTRFFGRPEPISTVPGLGQFMDRQSAFIAQKCSVEYCRARAGVNWDKLMLEAPFIEAMEICRWEAFSAVLSDLAVMVEGHFRSRTPGRETRLAEAVTRVAAGVYANYPAPPHRPEPSWRVDIEGIRTRLARAQLAPVGPVHEIGRTAGARIHAVIPIHGDLMIHDRELVQNNVRFNMCRAYEDLTSVLEDGPVLDELLGRNEA